MASDFIIWIQQLPQLKWRFLDRTTEEKINELENEFKLAVPDDFKLLLLHSNGGTVYGSNNVFAWFNTEEIALINDDPSYTDYLNGLFLIGDDNGNSIFAYDPNNLWEKGHNAIFMLDDGSLSRKSSVYIASNIREMLSKMDEGIDFSALPWLGDTVV
ncbi:MAG: SMI1/KNR4 family protein [Bacteroidota bacterium]|nr:SMI1/KNR4 family protein [Bacteroidota bacterium]